MKLTKSKLKQIIKEVYDSKAAARGDYDYDAGAGHKAYTDEWGKHTTSDALKHSKKAWFSSHWRYQILQKIEDREPVPPDHVWRRIRRELDAAGIYRPGPEADTLIDKILADMRQQALPHNLKAIPAYWTRPLNENKLTKSKLQQIIKEELKAVLMEDGKGCADTDKGCIRKRKGGWVILNNKKGGVWRECDSREHCEEILDAFHASKG